MTCHALACPNPALPGALQCREHWLMLPAGVRAKKPWVDAMALNARIPAEKPVNAKCLERGQRELFA